MKKNFKIIGSFLHKKLILSDKSAFKILKTVSFKSDCFISFITIKDSMMATDNNPLLQKTES